MKKLIKQNYDGRIKDGSITVDTDIYDLLNEMDENIVTMCKELEENGINEKMDGNLADVILTMLNFAYHNGIDIEQVMKDKIKKNFKR